MNKVALALSALLLSTSALAQGRPIRLDILHGQGHHAMPLAQAVPLAREAIRLLEAQTPARIRIARIRSVPLKSVTLDSFSFGGQLYAPEMESPWPRRVRRRAVLVLAPPLVEPFSPRRFVAGVATLCSPRTGYAVAYVQAENHEGEDRLAHSLVVISHELAHLVGAEHDEQEGPATIMHPAAVAFVDEQGGELDFSGKSVGEVRRCLRRKR